MLQIENEYETPIDPNYYQNNNNRFENPGNTQKITEYTEEKLKGSSSTNNIFQITPNKIQLPTEIIWTIPLLLQSPKSKDFHPRPRY